MGFAFAIDGLALSAECMDSSREGPPGAEAIVTRSLILEGIGIAAADLVMKHLGHGVAGATVLLSELTIPVPPNAIPEEVLPSFGQELVDAVNGIRIDLGDLFIAVGIDNSRPANAPRKWLVPYELTRDSL